jgi:hypothetical protein
MAQPQCLDGQLMPDTRPHTNGHFLATGRVLRTAHGGSALFCRTMFPVETLEAAGQAGAKFSVHGLEVTATFAMTGDLRGHLRLVRSGEAICDRPLANGIEDSYQKWAGDPRQRRR